MLDTVGWLIWPVKIVPDMTYNVFGGMLNPTLIFAFTSSFTVIPYPPSVWGRHGGMVLNRGESKKTVKGNWLTLFHLEGWPLNWCVYVRYVFEDYRCIVTSAKLRWRRIWSWRSPLRRCSCSFRGERWIVFIQLPIGHSFRPVWKWHSHCTSSSGGTGLCTRSRPASTTERWSW